MATEDSAPNNPPTEHTDRVFKTPGVDEALAAYYALREKLGNVAANLSDLFDSIGTSGEAPVNAPYESPRARRNKAAADDWSRLFNEASNANHQAQPEQPTREHAPGGEISAIIAKAIAANRQASWLQNIPQSDVAAVINTVRILRGKGLSDWEAYKKYRLKAETNPTLTQKVQILDALAGGTLGKNMKLPF